MAYPFRIRAGAVFCELLLPQGRSRKHAVIFLPGLPSRARMPELGAGLAARGFTCVALRYRGTWESDGEFCKNSPVEDVHAVVGLLQKRTVTELVNLRRLPLDVQTISLCGSSFGGYVALAAAKKIPSIKKAVLISPVISMAELGTNPAWPEEIHDVHERKLRRAWTNLYRYDPRSYRKLSSDALVGNGHKDLGKLRTKGLLVFHSANDEVVNVHRSRAFVASARAEGIDIGYRELRQGHNIRLLGARVNELVRFLGRAL